MDALIARLDTTDGIEGTYMYTVDEIRKLESFSYEALYDALVDDALPIDFDFENRVCRIPRDDFKDIGFMSYQWMYLVHRGVACGPQCPVHDVMFGMGSFKNKLCILLWLLCVKWRPKKIPGLRKSQRSVKKEVFAATPTHYLLRPNALTVDV